VQQGSSIVTITRFRPGQYTITGLDPAGEKHISLQILLYKQDVRHLEEVLNRLKLLRGVLFKDSEIESLENEIISAEEALTASRLSLAKAELMYEEVRTHGHG
jgi:hypothetical protein